MQRSVFSLLSPALVCIIIINININNNNRIIIIININNNNRNYYYYYYYYENASYNTAYTRRLIKNKLQLPIHPKVRAFKVVLFVWKNKKEYLKSINLFKKKERRKPSAAQKYLGVCTSEVFLLLLRVLSLRE